MGFVNGIEWNKFLDIKESTIKELLLEFLAIFTFNKLHRIDYDRKDTIQFRLGGVLYSISIFEFGVQCGFYDEGFLEEEKYQTSSFQF